MRVHYHADLQHDRRHHGATIPTDLATSTTTSPAEPLKKSVSPQQQQQNSHQCLQQKDNEDDACCAHQQEQAEQQQQKRDNKQGVMVRFNEESNHLYETAPRDSELYQELWYSVAQLNRFKKEVARHVKDINKVEKSHQDPCSFRQVFISAYSACCALTTERTTTIAADDDDTDAASGADLLLGDAQRQHSLAMWMGIAQDRWGLERAIVKPIYHDKTYRKKAMVRMVTEMQDMSARLGLPVRGETLQKACASMSRPSELFARILAEAQAAALRATP